MAKVFATLPKVIPSSIERERERERERENPKLHANHTKCTQSSREASNEPHARGSVATASARTKAHDSGFPLQSRLGIDKD